MALSFVPNSHERRHVAAGTAVRLRAARSAGGELWVTNGRAWITFDRTAGLHGPLPRGADFFVESGARQSVPAGASFVLEAAGAAGESVAFVWHLQAAQSAMRNRRTAEMALSLGELRQASRDFGLATRALLSGLVRVGWAAAARPPKPR